MQDLTVKDHCSHVSCPCILFGSHNGKITGFFRHLTDILKLSVVLHVLPLPARQHQEVLRDFILHFQQDKRLFDCQEMRNECVCNLSSTIKHQFHPNHPTINNVRCSRIQSCILFHGITTMTKNVCSSFFSFAVNCCVFLKTPLINQFFLKRRLQLDQQMAPASHSCSCQSWRRPRLGIVQKTLKCAESRFSGLEKSASSKTARQSHKHLTSMFFTDEVDQGLYCVQALALSCRARADCIYFIANSCPKMSFYNRHKTKRTLQKRQKQPFGYHLITLFGKHRKCFELQLTGFFGHVQQQEIHWQDFTVFCPVQNVSVSFQLGRKLLSRASNLISLAEQSNGSSCSSACEIPGSLFGAGHPETLLSAVPYMRTLIPFMVFCLQQRWKILQSVETGV